MADVKQARRKERSLKSRFFFPLSTFRQIHAFRDLAGLLGERQGETSHIREALQSQVISALVICSVYVALSRIKGEGATSLLISSE